MVKKRGASSFLNIYIYIYIYYIYIYINNWIKHDQSAQQQGAIYKLHWESIRYNMTDTTSFILGNLQSIFLPSKKQKDFISNKKT